MKKPVDGRIILDKQAIECRNRSDLQGAIQRYDISFITRMVGKFSVS